MHDIGARTSENNPHAPEWDQQVARIGMEDTALLTDEGPQYLVPRQEDWLLIPSD